MFQSMVDLNRVLRLSNELRDTRDPLYRLSLSKAIEQELAKGLFSVSNHLRELEAHPTTF
jgi:hypothetical protein